MVGLKIMFPKFPKWYLFGFTTVYHIIANALMMAANFLA